MIGSNAVVVGLVVLVIVLIVLTIPRIILYTMFLKDYKGFRFRGIYYF